MRAPIRAVWLDTEELIVVQISLVAFVMAGRTASICGRMASTRTSSGIYFQKYEGYDPPVALRSLLMLSREEQWTSENITRHMIGTYLRISDI